MTALGIFFLTFVVMVVIKLPMYLCLLGSSMLYIFLNPQLTMMAALEKMMNAANSFTLLAVPFFIFAGQVMNTGGVSRRIFAFANVLVGHLRGGLAYVNVLASLIFSGITGSALADVGGLGMIEMKAMKDENYDDDIILGVTGASSTVGPIIPPSIPFVVFGAMANVSIGGLFFAGIIPGVVISLVLCAFIFIVARRRNYPKKPMANASQLWYAFKEAFWALCFPLIIIGGIWTGWFTPTEAAFVSILYGLIISMLIYKEIKWTDISHMAIDTIRLVGPAITVVVGTSLFAWVLTYEKVDQMVLYAIFSITNNKYVILLLINLLLLFLGMFIEVVAAIMITLPILMPIIEVIGMHPIHLGVIIVLNMMIGLLTPPVGMSLYMMSSISGISFGRVTKMVLPWLAPLLISLLIVTYCEPVVMWLPTVLGFVTT